MKKSANRFCAFVATCLLLTAAAWGQSFLGSINGSVTDASGAVVPEANVTLTDVGTGIQRTAKTNTEGNYYFGNLPPGTYTLVVAKEGFREVRSSNILLTAQQLSRFDATLELGSTTQTVEVSATAPTLNTENAQLGGVLARNELLNLPLNNRSTLNFIMLSSYNYQGDGSSYMLGGMAGNSTNFTIDGVSANTGVFAGQVGPMTQESFDSIRELKTLVSNNSAEYPNVGTLLISSRSGTNQVHGSLFYYHSNNALNARSFFASEKPKGPILHNFGGSFGGPVVIPHVYDGHNRTFFYFTYERQNFPGEYSGTGIVPDAKMQTGDFSELLPDTVLTDPTTGQPFPGNIIPASRVSSVALNLQSFGFLQPNFGPADLYAPGSSGYNWVGIFPTADHDTRYVTRLDHQISSRDALSARASLRMAPEPLQFDADLPIFVHNQGRSTQNAYISETHSFSSTLLNEFRVGFSRDASDLAGAHRGAQVVQQVGLQGIDLSTKGNLAGVPDVNFNNFSSMYEFPTYFWRTQTLEFLDNVTWVKGKHNLKAGFLLRHIDNNISQCCSSDFGTLNFDGFATGFDYADFLLGLPHSSDRYSRNQPSVPQYNEWGFFVQDNYQVSGKLTLNLGLRYEYFPSIVDKYDMAFSFDPKTGNLILASSRSQRLLNPLFPKSIPLVLASAAGYPARSLLENDNKNLGPRVGFAYRPLGNTRTVVRGGYGVYYTRLVYTREPQFGGGGPFISDETFTNTIVNGAPSLQFPNPFPGVGALGTQSISANAKFLRTPMSQQWNLTVERELPGAVVARVGYRGMRVTQLPYSGDINKPYPSADPAGENFFRYPNFYSVYFNQSGGNRNLQALDVSVERKFAQGLTFQSGWTWAKNLAEGNPDGEGIDYAAENPYNRQREYGNAQWVPRHRWASYLQYDLPYGKGKRFGSTAPKAVTSVLGNWGTSLVTLFQTGQFLTPGFDGADPSNTRTYGGRPDQVGAWNVSNSTITQWFNPSAFAIPPNGRYGNAANGVIVGPGLANLDFGLFRYFNIKERVRAQLRMTAANFFNHPNFGNPNTDISSRNVGRIRSVQGRRADTLGGGARTIQVGLRFDF